MKKKWLASVLAASACLAGSFGFTACVQTPEPEKEAHTHSWSAWTVSDENKPAAEAAGKATRTCSNDGCDADETLKEYVLPALTSTDYTKSQDTATCSAAGAITYTYVKNGVSVNFGVETPVNAEAHKYGEYIKTDPEGHYQVCGHNSAHTTEKTAHDTDGEDGACSVCGYKEPAVHSHSWGVWTVSEANKPTADATGKATRTCGGEGDCDAEASLKEYTLPALTSTDYTKSQDTATCSATGEITYTYNKDGVNVNFTVATAINAEAHQYGAYVKTDPEGHYKVCGHNSAHTTEKTPHDTDGEGGACSVCGYNPETPPHAHSWDAWTVSEANKPSAEAAGKATRTCGGEGDCDAETSLKEYTLPALTSEDYTVTTKNAATCASTGIDNYAYNKDGVSVNFDIETPVNPDAHVFAEEWTFDISQHWHVAACEHTDVTSEKLDHVNAEGKNYCKDCYVTKFTSTNFRIGFVAGNGIKFTVYVFASGADDYVFTYTGAEQITCTYSSYVMGEGENTKTQTLVNGETFTISVAERESGILTITSESETEFEGTLVKPAELEENENGFPVQPTKEGEAYIFTGYETEAGDKFRYVLNTDNPNAEIYVDGENGEKEKITLPYKFRLADGVKKVFYMSYGETAVSSYSVSVDREYDEGTIMNPVSAKLGEECSVTVTGGDEVYAAFVPAEDGWYKITSSSEKAVLVAGSKTTLSYGAVYGEGVKGFDYRVNITNASIYGEGSGFWFRIGTQADEENVTFTVEQFNGPDPLSVGSTSTGNDFYEFTATGPDYMISVSELPECGYWTVSFEKHGDKTTLNVTSLKAVISPDAGNVSVIYGNAAGSVTLAEDDSALHVSLGASKIPTANKDYYFTAPYDATYSFTTTLNNTTYLFWRVNGEMKQTATVTLELKAGDIVTMQVLGKNLPVTVLPEDNAKLKVSASTEVTVNKGSQMLLYFTGTANLTYPLTIAGEGVQFADGGTSAEITANASGNVLAYIEYTGEGESATVSVTVHSAQISVEEATAVSVDKISNKLIYFAGTANVSYNLKITGEGVQFVGGGTSKEVTADASGSVSALVECTGESAEVSVSVEQIPFALELDTVYSKANSNILVGYVVYEFTAKEAGNYVLSGLYLTSSYTMTVDGEEISFPDATSQNRVTSYTFENLQAGQKVTFSVEYIRSSGEMKISYAPAEEPAA